MNLDEYKESIKKMIDDPDTAQATAKDIIDSLEADDANRQTAENKINELNDRIVKLNETNSKLFMSVTGSPEKEEEEPEKTPEEIFGDLFDEYYYGGDANGKH